MLKVPDRRASIALALGLALAATVLVVLAGVVEVERTVSGVCLLHPATEWTLQERRAGSYESKAVDLVTGEVLHYRLYQFDRPAFLDLELPRLSAGAPTRVEAGQRVAAMRSSALEIELTERGTAIAEARANVRSLREGSKPERLERARLAHERAAAEREAFRPHYERQRDLFEKGIVSEEVWEETVMRRDLLDLDWKLAAAEVEVFASGAGPEKIAGAELALAAIERELAAVEAMRDAQEIMTPIGGSLRVAAADGLLLSVASADRIIARILVPQSSASLLAEGLVVKVYIPGLAGGPAAGKVVRVDRQALVTDAGPFISVYGLLGNEGGALTAGMEGRSRLYCGKTTLLARFWDDLRRTVRRELWST